MGSSKKLIFLCGIFIAGILAANTLASKVFMVGGFAMTAGIIAFPITFLVTDIVNDVWGKGYAKTMVMAGLAANILMVILYQIGVLLPAAPFWEHQVAFETLLGAVPRIVLASMTAYLISQMWDVWVFAKIKEKFTMGLWFRNNVSTFTSQIVDSAVFLAIAFAGTMPVNELVTMFFTYIIVKWIIAIIDTPLIYLGVKWAKSGGDDIDRIDPQTLRNYTK